MTEDNELIEHIARHMFERRQERRYEGPQAFMRLSWPPARETAAEWLESARDALTAYRNHEVEL